MEQGMKRQRGAALVIVLALLTGALVVGVSSMQSSLIDERLAGNYRASAQAQMNAEQAAALAIPNIEESYSKDDAKENRDDLKKKYEISTPEDVKQLRYADVDAKNPKGKTDGNCDDEDENRCFYFPLAIGGEDYWAAFGAVKSDAGKGSVVSQHAVLVRLKPQGGSSGDEIKEIFNKYGILSGDEVEVDAEEKNIPFYGLIHGNKNDAEGESGDLDVKFKSSDNEDVEESGFSTGYVQVSKFDFSGYFKGVKNGKFNGYSEKSPNCSIGSVANAEQFCNEEVVIGVSQIYRSAVYFSKSVTIEGALMVTSSTIFVDGDLTVEGSVNVNSAGGVSNIIVTGDVVFDADGRDEQNKEDEHGDDEDKDDEKDEDDDDGENNNPVGLDLSNTVVVSGNELEFDAMSGQGLRNVLIMSADEMDIHFDGINKIDKGWFYSGDELEMEIEESPNMTFCGSLMAREDVDLDTDPYIKRFDSSGRNGCPKFSGFDGPLSDGGGKLGFDAWE